MILKKGRRGRVLPWTRLKDNTVDNDTEMWAYLQENGWCIVGTNPVGKSVEQVYGCLDHGND